MIKKKIFCGIMLILLTIVIIFKSQANSRVYFKNIEKKIDNKKYGQAISALSNRISYEIRQNTEKTNKFDFLLMQKIIYTYARVLSKKIQYTQIKPFVDSLSITLSRLEIDDKKKMIDNLIIFSEKDLSSKKRKYLRTLYEKINLAIKQKEPKLWDLIKYSWYPTMISRNLFLYDEAKKYLKEINVDVDKRYFYELRLFWILIDGGYLSEAKSLVEKSVFNQSIVKNKKSTLYLNYISILTFLEKYNEARKIILKMRKDTPDKYKKLYSIILINANRALVEGEVINAQNITSKDHYGLFTQKDKKLYSWSLEAYIKTLFYFGFYDIAKKEIKKASLTPKKYLLTKFKKDIFLLSLNYKINPNDNKNIKNIREFKSKINGIQPLSSMLDVLIAKIDKKNKLAFKKLSFIKNYSGAGNMDYLYLSKL